MKKPKNEVRFTLSDTDKALLDAIATDSNSKPGVFAKGYLLKLLRQQQQEKM